MNDDILLAKFLQLAFSKRDHIPGKKAFQKLLYLAQAEGFPSNYEFRLHFYGPYSADAANDLEVLRDAGAILAGADDRIRSTPFLTEVAQQRPLTAEERGAANRVLSSFVDRAPLDLELLATTHFMWALERRSSAHPADEVVERRVKRYKGDKFTDEEIKGSIHELRQAELIN